MEPRNPYGILPTPGEVAVVLMAVAIVALAPHIIGAFVLGWL